MLREPLSSEQCNVVRRRTVLPFRLEGTAAAAAAAAATRRGPPPGARLGARRGRRGGGGEDTGPARHALPDPWPGRYRLLLCRPAQGRLPCPGSV